MSSSTGHRQEQACIAVIDIGKTHARLSVIDSVSGTEVRSVKRVNQSIVTPLGRQLDVVGIETWLIEALQGLPERQQICALVPIAHGAAAVLLDADGAVLAAPDYEDPQFSAVDADYASERDAFSATYSPQLPLGLNLARQWFYLERRHPGMFARVAHILLFPQYWAWRFSGVMASEMTSLGCHTDLWRPEEKTFSALANAHDWVRLLPDIHAAGDSLGSIEPSVAHTAGLPKDCRVVCGIHDSNASYLEHLVDRPRGDAFTVVSSGTWTVVMASGADLQRLRPGRDMLANVDAFGAPLCTARFMGGREYDAIAGSSEEPQLAALESILQRHVMAVPSFARGGPFASSPGRLHHAGAVSSAERVALATLYCALMSELLLDYLGARGDIIVDGPLATNALYGPLLAALRPETTVLLEFPRADAARAVCHLADVAVPLGQPLTRTSPLRLAGLDRYRAAWRDLLPRESA